MLRFLTGDAKHQITGSKHLQNRFLIVEGNLRIYIWRDLQKNTQKAQVVFTQRRQQFVRNLGLNC